MTNTELIDLFRNVERSNHPVCNGCPMKYTCDKNQITRCLFGTAADALEVADEKIVELQKQVNEFIKNETHSSVIKAMSRRIAELEKELEIWTARSFEGKIGSMALTNLNLRMEISKLEAQLPKEGEWIIIGISVNGSSTAKCSKCGAIVHDSFTNTPNYCPNCGARMIFNGKQKTESKNIKSPLEYDYCGTPKRRYDIEVRNKRANDE